MSSAIGAGPPIIGTCTPILAFTEPDNTDLSEAMGASGSKPEGGIKGVIAGVGGAGPECDVLRGDLICCWLACVRGEWRA